MQDPDHVRLLTLEADAIFGLEPPSSSPQPPSHRIMRDPALHALLIWSSRGVVTALSRALTTQLAVDPDSVVSQAAASIAALARFRLQASSTLAMAPAYLVHLQDALGLPSHAIAGGPTWIVPDTLRTAPYSIEGLPAGVRIVTSLGEEDREWAKGLSRPGNWEAEEWAQLLAATETNAPWAMAVLADDGEVVCICHTPARNAQVVEAGVWTRDDWRGRGLAPRTVAAWATTHAPDTTLFYSTAKDNAASQAVARKLGLREFGYIWKLLAVAGR
ncbi:hypothetical protein LMH87_001199 [Akanthomyces muscarius]|uniref:N-acetyltransferase domain-containing protein n=1 Tax=Akanthomyces muscarius TaxID=2231603 RepID=A0A9W8QG29_AKAMU|nr:hypothetical protein LMH87_001199 [Akanthomyces muscarius]KAJ4155982.1 hypothetical protein LMH87_001199 [Akanthomyces muscarius]